MMSSPSSQYAALLTTSATLSSRDSSSVSTRETASIMEGSYMSPTAHPLDSTPILRRELRSIRAVFLAIFLSVSGSEPIASRSG